MSAIDRFYYSYVRIQLFSKFVSKFPYEYVGLWTVPPQAENGCMLFSSLALLWWRPLVDLGFGDFKQMMTKDEIEMRWNLKKIKLEIDDDLDQAEEKKVDERDF